MSGHSSRLTSSRKPAIFVGVTSYTFLLVRSSSLRRVFFTVAKYALPFLRRFCRIYILSTVGDAALLDIFLRWKCHVSMPTTLLTCVLMSFNSSSGNERAHEGPLRAFMNPLVLLYVTVCARQWYCPALVLWVSPSILSLILTFSWWALILSWRSLYLLPNYLYQVL